MKSESESITAGPVIGEHGSAAAIFHEASARRSSEIPQGQPSERASYTSPAEHNPKHDVAIERKSQWALYRRHCDDLCREVQRLPEFLLNDRVIDEGLEVVVEIEATLDNLYECPWGQSDKLKAVVMVIRSQILNAAWDRRHVEFLSRVAQALRLAYLIDDCFVDSVFQMIDENDLEPFRGTVTETSVRKRYRMEEIKDSQ